MTTKFFTGGALAALAAALAFTAVPASAQDRHHRDRDSDSSAQAKHDDRGATKRSDRAPAWGSRNRGDTPQRTNTPARTQSQGQWSGRHADTRTQAQTTTRGGWAGWNGNRATNGGQSRTYVDQNRNTTYVDRNRHTTYRDTHRDNDRDWRGDRRSNDRNWSSRDNNYQRWDRNWRNNNRYDWQRYRTYNRSAYHMNRYYAPYRNYSYRRLGIGFQLDPLFFGQDYLIGNPGYYRLPDVYGPYRWVRYYDDALLVDVYSGQVVDVIYDFFW
jgi:hypothetical protein